MEDELVFMCGNCNSPCCANERRHSIQLATTENCNSMFNELFIVDALSYVYGYSWQHYQLKTGCYEAENESQVSIAFCEGCALLLEENYKAHQNFQNASHIESIVYQVKNSRNESLLGVIKTEAVEEVRLGDNYSGDDLFPNLNVEDDNLQTPLGSPTALTEFEETDLVDVKRELPEEEETKNHSKFSQNDQLNKQKRPVLKIEKLSEENINSFCDKLKKRKSSRIGKDVSSNLKTGGKRKNCSRIANNRKLKGGQNISSVGDFFPTQMKSDITCTQNGQGDDEHCDPFDIDATLPLDKPRSSTRIQARKSSVKTSIQAIRKTNEKLHSKQKKHTVLSDDLKKAYTPRGPGGRYKCKLCEHSTAKRDYLVRHMKKVHGPRVRCEICGGMYGDIKLHMWRHEGKKEMCTLCNKEFTGLYAHMKNKHSSNKRLFPCNQCDRTYSSKSGLQRHLEFHVNGKVQCETCGKFLASIIVLKLHEQTHSDFKPFQCSDCPKMFRRKVELKRHSYSHAGRDFVCEHCGKNFKHPSQFKRHVQGHLELEMHGERSFACEQCPKLFNTQFDLCLHNRRCHRTDVKQRVFKCRFCGKVLASSGSIFNLRVHESRHIKLGHSMKFDQQQEEEQKNFVEQST